MLKHFDPGTCTWWNDQLSLHTPCIIYKMLII